MLLIVGLGNYGIEYKNTKHNCGFAVVDKICDENGIDLNKKGFKSLFYEGRLFDEKVVLAKPLTYMNNSGEAVRELAKFYKPEKTLIIYDDIDIPFGTIRYRANGSAGTHNGMRSVVNCMSTQDIPRLRIGIKPEDKIYNLADYVLSKIEKNHREDFEKSIELAYQKVKDFVFKKGEI